MTTYLHVILIFLKSANLVPRVKWGSLYLGIYCIACQAAIISTLPGVHYKEFASIQRQRLLETKGGPLYIAQQQSGTTENTPSIMASRRSFNARA